MQQVPLRAVLVNYGEVMPVTLPNWFGCNSF